MENPYAPLFLRQEIIVVTLVKRLELRTPAVSEQHPLVGFPAGSRLKSPNQVRGPGAGRRKSGAYTEVFEHFSPFCNTAIEPQAGS
jgi:hypothetical protein